MTDFFAISSKYFYSIKYWKPSKNPNYSNSFWYYLLTSFCIFCQFGIFWHFSKNFWLDFELQVTTTKNVALNCMISEQNARSSKQNKTPDLVIGPELALYIFTSINFMYVINRRWHISTTPNTTKNCEHS